MFYEWDKNLETGHEAIDSQHRQLFVTLNHLNEASGQGKTREEIFGLIEYLSGYTVKHFMNEEELQLQYGYPNYNAHKKLHDEFRVTVDNLGKRFFDEGPSEDLIDLITRTIGEWFVYHIQGEDTVMANFVKSKVCC